MPYLFQKISQDDLDHILRHTRPFWEKARNQRFFMTGGTGFFGRWLVESFCHINRQLDLEASLTVLSRNPAAFYADMPHLSQESALTLISGDVRTFDFPSGTFPFILHAATDADGHGGQADPQLVLETIIQGTQQVLAFAKHASTERFLLTSSGAVYGKQPADMTHIPESYSGGPDLMSPNAAYGEGKRLAELLCAAASTTGLIPVIARCFAFVGPHLPLNKHFAIGNFIRDALAGQPITIQGDGTPYRSYLYAADLTVWLWTLLFEGRPCHPYNVGSEEDMPLSAVAQQTAQAINPDVPIHILKTPQPGQPIARYVPSTKTAQTDLNLRQHISLAEALTRTAAWHRASMALLEALPRYECIQLGGN